MNKSAHTITRLNLKTIRGAYIATIAGVACLAANYIIYMIQEMKGIDLTGNDGVSVGWAVWALPVAAGIIISAVNFRRIMSLGGTRKDYFKGSLVSYVIICAAASLLGLVCYYAVDIPFVATGLYGGMISVPEVFGWNTYGPLVFFLQQFAFLLLTAFFTHTFCALQGTWYGWVVNAAFIAGIPVFSAIEPLRNILAGYFYLIFFQPNPLLQILCCLVIGFAFYMLSKPVYARKPI